MGHVVGDTLVSRGRLLSSAVSVWLREPFARGTDLGRERVPGQEKGNRCLAIWQTAENDQEQRDKQRELSQNDGLWHSVGVGFPSELPFQGGPASSNTNPGIVRRCRDSRCALECLLWAAASTILASPSSSGSSVSGGRRQRRTGRHLNADLYAFQGGVMTMRLYSFDHKNARWWIVNLCWKGK